MTQYLLSVHHAEDFRPSQEAIQKIFSDVATFNDELVVAGALIFAGGFQPTSMGRSPTCPAGFPSPVAWLACAAT